MKILRLSTLRAIALTLFAIFALTATQGCSSPDTAAEIAAADNAIADGDNNLARQICDKLLDKNGSSLSATQLAHLSLLYMQLADASDDSDGIDRACRCWRDAMNLNTDSAMTFYRSVPVEQQRNVILLAAIVHTFDRADQMPGVEWTADEFSHDSIPEFTDEHHSHE